MRATEFIIEGDVVSGNFGTGKGEEELGLPIPKGYKSFQTKQISDKGATQIIGVKDDGTTKVISTVTSPEGAEALAQYYNSGRSTRIKPLSMAQAFGSKEYNIISDLGYKFHEKPSYFSDLQRDPLSELDLQKIKNALKKNGFQLKMYSDIDIYDEAIDEEYNSPLSRTKWIPPEDVFVIEMDLTGNEYLVDKKGAKSYIRFWKGIR